MKKIFLITLCLLSVASGFAAKGTKSKSAQEQQTSFSADDLMDITWEKQFFKMKVLNTMTLVAESDSMFQMEGDGIRVIGYVEDRATVSEEDVAIWAIENALGNNVDLSRGSLEFLFKGRCVSSFFNGYYTQQDGTPSVATYCCSIDKKSRRIYTIILFCAKSYENIVDDIIKSVDIMENAPQY